MRTWWDEQDPLLFAIWVAFLIALALAGAPWWLLALLVALPLAGRELRLQIEAVRLRRRR